MSKLLQKDQDSLTPNTSQTGLEKVVGLIGTYIFRVANSLSNVFYGANKLQNDKKANGIQKAVDRGLINVFNQLSEIDICNLFNYLSNNKLGAGFNPKDPEPAVTDPTIKKVKYKVQMGAFKLQSLIDNYFAGGTSLIQFVRSVNLSLSSLVNDNVGLTDPELRKEYPEVDLIRNFLNDKLTDLSLIITQSTNGTIPADRVQSVIDTINKIRAYCVAIQALNNPAAVISVLPSSIQAELDKLNSIVKPEKFTPLIYRLLKTCNNINSTCRSILTYVSRARVLIRLAILLVRVFNLIQAFFLTLPVPNIGTTAGVTTTFSSVFQEKLKEQGEKKLLKVLKQILNILDDIYVLVSGIIFAVTDVIRTLNIILLNLKSCNRDQDLISQIESTIKELENTRSDLQSFIDQVNEGRKRIDNTFGGYIIEIVSEQLTDEGVRLRRRYGIARGLNGIIAVQSTPTFATLDEIIINEVKVLLVSKGLVQASISSPENEKILQDAMAYLEDSDISTPTESLQVSTEGDTQLGLQTFVNNLPGGKELNKKVRKKLLQNSANLGNNLKNTDPNDKYSSSVTPKST